MPHTSSRDELAARVFEASHLTGDFLLRSGVRSEEYFDKYLFESDPTLLRQIAEALVALLPPGMDALAGLELGGVPLAVLVSQVCGLPALFVRKEAKTYGTCRLAEGGGVERRSLAIIEDVITSGGQVIASANALRERGAEAETVLCVIDREAGGRAHLRDQGLELRSLFTMSELTAAAGPAGR
jgi:orotate phosphoribosyltransferase